MKKLVQFTLSLLLLISNICLAQSGLDSLEVKLKTLPSNSIEKVNLLNEIGLEYWIIDSNKSLIYGEEASNISKSISYDQGLADAERILGVAHWTKGNLVEAIKHLNSAQKIYSDINNEVGLANSMLNTGMVYADLKQYDKALNLFEQSIDKFTILNMDNRVATAFTKMGTLYMDEGKLVEAKKYLDNALSIHNKNNFTYGITEAHNRLGILFITQGNTEQAYYHIKKSITLGLDINDKDGAVSNMIQFGKILRMDGEYASADIHLKNGLRRAIDNSLKKYELEAYSELKDLKISERKLDSSLYYYDKYVTLKDSLFTSEKSTQIAALAFENEMEAKDKEVLLLQKEEETNNVIKWALLAGVILITVAGLIIISTIRQRAKKVKELGEQRQQLLASKEELARTALENAELKQQELEQKLDYKNKELTSYTLNFVQKNQFLQQLQEKVTLAKKATAKEKDKIIDGLSRDIKQSVSIDKDWEDFKRYFEDVHTDFFKKLKDRHPDLSSNDLKICSLTRLNLNVKETANVLGISPESAKTARYRLRKKLDLAPKDELLDYFLMIEQG